MNTSKNTSKSGYMTLIGLPNAGKSSLLNRLVGENLAIVTPKAQTTRTLLRGYVSRPGLKLVLTDTPGLQEGTRALNMALARNVARAMEQAVKGREVICAVFDCYDVSRRITAGKPSGLEQMPRILEGAGGKIPLPLPVLPVFNKCDALESKVARERLFNHINEILTQCFETVLPAHYVSAKTGEGIDGLLAAVTALLPEENGEGAPFDEEELSDQNVRDFVAEFIREQCFLKLGEEIPYSVAVEIDEFDESNPKLPRIQASLHVERESQKAIVIGTGGTKIKEIGTEARKRIEQFLGTKVFLGLRVKVSPKWASEARLVERFGYGSIN